MEYLKIIGLSSLSVFVLFFLTKAMGRREMAQLSMFDYIVGITIGSIAAEMATSLEDNFMQPLIAMIIYALITILISIISRKSVRFRKIVNGKSLILLNNGKLYRENFKKARLDLNEFLTQCRTNSYFNLNDLEAAIIEPNGKISFLQKTMKRPAFIKDLNLNVKQEKMVVDLIVDGKILEDNLKSINQDKKWLQQELNKNGFKSSKMIFLATYDDDEKLSLYEKNIRSNSHDNF